MKEIDFFYENLYEEVLNRGAVGFVSKIVHKTLERGLRDHYFQSVLEVGAGHGQHFQHVSHKFDSYLQTDIVPFWEKSAKQSALESSTQLSSQVANAEDLSGFSDNEFNRLIATCLLAHLKDPETALTHWRRVVEDGGLVTIHVPTEPGFMLRLLRKLTTARKLNKRGLDSRLVHYKDHINFWISMDVIIRDVFSKDSIKRKRYPFPFVSWNFALWDVYQISVNKRN